MKTQNSTPDNCSITAAHIWINLNGEYLAEILLVKCVYTHTHTKSFQHQMTVVKQTNATHTWCQLI